MTSVDTDPLSWEHVRVEQQERTAIVWLARPPVNAVDLAMYRELRGAFRSLYERDDIGAVVLAAEGRHFCAGNDLDDFMSMTPQNAPERMRLVREAFFAIADMPLPVIAAVQGSALGTGLAIVASCDVVVAATDARFGTPEVGVGVMGAAKHLSRLVPPNLQREMYFSAEPRSAAELAPYGAISRIVPPDELLEAALAIAGSFTRHSSLVLRYAKRALDTIEHLDLEVGYEYEQSLTAELCGADDSREALAALVERRPPEYRHRH